MKNLFKISILLILPLIFFTGCTEEEEIVTGSTNTIDDYIYPISLNNNWIYEGHYVINFIDEGSAPSDYEALDLLFTNVVIVDSMYNEDNIYRFKTISVEENGGEEDLFIGYRYFSNDDDGLYNHGGTPSSLVTPWSRKSQYFYKINNKIYSIDQLIDLLNYGAISRDDVCWEDSPVLSVSYPVNLDEQWMYREFVSDCDEEEEDSDPFRMDKLVIEKTENTFTIQTLYDLDEDSEWDEDLEVFHTYSIDGLTNYRIEMNNQVLVDELGNELGLVNSFFNHDLVGSEIY